MYGLTKEQESYLQASETVELTKQELTAEVKLLKVQIKELQSNIKALRDANKIIMEMYRELLNNA